MYKRQVLGSAADLDDVADPPVIDGVAPILEHRSATLPALADTLMKLSQNLYAETFLRTLGRLKGTGGTANAGIDVVRRVLESWGVPASELVMADGSGLSRYDLVTADAMTTVLAHVYNDTRLRDPYVASLPVAAAAGLLLLPLVSRLTGHIDAPRPLRNPSAHPGDADDAAPAFGAAS